MKGREDDRPPQGAAGAFLHRLIDDASPFPPASLPLAEAVGQHRAHRHGPYRWLLGRFVVTASRLGDLLPLLREEDAPRRLSVVLNPAPDRPWPDAVGDALATVAAFAEGAQGLATVESLEARLPAGAEATAFARALAEGAGARGLGASLFVEVPFGEGWERQVPAALEAVAAAGLGAKVRCGGSRAQDFPTVPQLARFIAVCARLGLPFKATAGLHHPLPHPDEALDITQHGFLNVLGGALLAYCGRLDEDGLAEMLADADPSRFHLDAEGFGWRDVCLGAAEVARGRQRVLCFGSCSFLEPIEGLQALFALPSLTATA